MSTGTLTLTEVRNKWQNQERCSYKKRAFCYKRVKKLRRPPRGYWPVCRRGSGLHSQTCRPSRIKPLQWSCQLGTFTTCLHGPIGHTSEHATHVCGQAMSAHIKIRYGFTIRIVVSQKQRCMYVHFAGRLFQRSRRTLRSRHVGCLYLALSHAARRCVDGAAPRVQ